MFGSLENNFTNYACLLSTDWPTPIANVGQFFYILLLVVVVSVLAYYTTRMVGNAKFARGGRRNLEILESMGVGPQSFVHILRVGGQYVLVGVTRGQVNFLTQIEDGQLVLPERPEGGVSFESLFSRFQKKDHDDHDDRGGHGDTGSDGGSNSMVESGKDKP